MSKSRINVLSNHLAGLNSELALSLQECIGERENSELDKDMEAPNFAKTNQIEKTSHAILKYKYDRIPIKIAFEDKTAADERYAGSGDTAILEGELIKPRGISSKTVAIFMHPSGIQNLLPMPNALARGGLHVVTCTSRYPNNDTCLIMEKVAIDLGAVVKHMKSAPFQYEKVILAGWSGGGSLSAFYQSQAENPTIEFTPANDKVSLKEAKLTKCDGLLLMASHLSRAITFTEWIDPAVLDENDPSVRDKELDLFNPLNPNKPPYSKEFIQKYQKAQIARNDRITDWCLAKLRNIETELKEVKEGWKVMRGNEPFLVHCTQADPRRLDLTLEPNQRPPTTLKTLAAENHSPVGLARFTTLRSFLSQWSLRLSNADAVSSLNKITIPVMVLVNGADHLVPSSHPQKMFAAIKHKNKKWVEISGANHYYFGQKELMARAVGEVIDFLRSHKLLEEKFE